MRMCFVARSLASPVGTGISSAVLALAEAAASRGNEVSILTEAGAPIAVPHPAITALYASVHDGRAARSPWGTENLRWSVAASDLLRDLPPFAYIEFPDYLAEGYIALRSKRTLGSFSSTTLAVRLHGTAALLRAFDETPTLDYDTALTEHLELSCLSDADLLVSASQAAINATIDVAKRRGLWRAAVPWSRAEHLSAIPIPPCCVPKPPASPDSQATVLLLGRLQRLKGVEEFVRAGREVLGRLGPDARPRFVLVGSDTHTGRGGGSMLADLNRLIGADAPHFTLTGGLSRSESLGLIDSATIVCIPSHFETFSVVLGEAMSRGAAIVAAAGGAIPEIVSPDKDAILVPPRDHSALASAILHLLASPAQRNLLGTAARATAATQPLRVATAEPHPLVHTTPPAAATPSPRVTAIIPHYNLSQFLPSTLRSLAQQTASLAEVILIDDGSTDPASTDYLNRAEAEWHTMSRGTPIRIVRQENAGLAATRNAGFRLAESDWVLMLDADDLVEPAMVASFTHALSLDPGAAFVSCFLRQFEHAPGDREDIWAPLGIDPDLQPAVNLAAASCAMVSKPAWEAVGGFDEWMTTYEDWEFWCRLASAGYRGAIVPEFLFWYRVRPDGMFRTASRAAREANRARILARHINRCPDPSRAARVLESRALDEADQRAAAAHAAEARARELVTTNLRYRLVDRLNAVAKRTGIAATAKPAIKWFLDR